jgi:DNA-binding TFAR19-related protein (PDSD5 family)
MSDDELTAIRQKKLQEFQRKTTAREQMPEVNGQDEVLNKIFKDRAWEVFNCASHQFPFAMKKVREILVELASSGKLAEVTGEDLYVFLKKLNLYVRLNTKINYASHGQLKSLGEKMKEDLRRT